MKKSCSFTLVKERIAPGGGGDASKNLGNDVVGKEAASQSGRQAGRQSGRQARAVGRRQQPGSRHESGSRQKSARQAIRYKLCLTKRAGLWLRVGKDTLFHSSMSNI